MHSSILEEVIAGLDAHRGKWPRISDETKVPYSTLQKIAQGRRTNPGVKAVVALHDWLTQHSTPPAQQAGWMGRDRRQQA